MNFDGDPAMMRSFAFVAAVSLLATSASAADLTFEKDIRPIFRAHCFDCHGAEAELKGKLDLRLVRTMVKGGESGAAIVQGKPANSFLLERIKSGEMPPGSHRVPDHQIALVEKWIGQGAKTARPEPASIGPGLGITPEERSYWAFQPIRRPSVPNVKAATRVRTPVDAFLLARMEEQNLSFADDAEKLTLVRRAYMDLIGLPPTPEQIKKFMDDTSETAWDTLIDELLQSKHYGERWGRHWLDVAGYADSEGHNRDDMRPWAYKYRDWVIRAINADMPFDQFITWQLAGDELVKPPYKNMSVENIDKLTATGFLRMASDGTGQINNEEIRNQVVTDTVKIVSSSLLGLSVGCAQCHDHRYDPISQVDYYRLRAVLEPALDYKSWKNPSQRRISLYTDEDIAKAGEIEKEAQAKGKQRNAKQAEYMETALKAELEKKEESLRKPLEDAYRTPGNKRTDEQKALLKLHPNIGNLSPGVLYQYNKGHADKLKAMDKEIAAIRAKKPKEEFLRVVFEGGKVPVTKLFYRGDYRQPKQDVMPGGLTVAAPADSPFSIDGNSKDLPSTGRRLAYAKWLTNEKHPLVARVLVNRFWLNHFGQTFVSTPGEFGKLGTPPTHPVLLDWLADEFMAKGWSLKEFHRLVMKSTVYRQKSLRTADADAIDGGNNLYSHFPVQRLEAEVIRDSILALAGKLTLDQFGPPTAVSKDDTGQIIINGDMQRRSVYLTSRRTEPVALLKSFDAPVMDVNCAIRQSSTVATQSLMLMNSDFILKAATAFAGQLNASAAGKVDAKLVEGLKLDVDAINKVSRDPWSYGYGFIDEAAESEIAPVRFTPLPFFGNNMWKGGAKVPDPKLGHLLIRADGGHPQGKTTRPIRRWTSPIDGQIEITGEFRHGSDNGDGVRLTIYHSHSGPHGSWQLKHKSTKYSVKIDVKKGHTIDAIVNEVGANTSDTYYNIYTIKGLASNGKDTLMWNSQSDFHGPLNLKNYEAKSSIAEQIAHGWQLAYGRVASREEVELSFNYVSEQITLLVEQSHASPIQQAMANYCQALLSSNEFLYVE